MYIAGQLFFSYLPSNQEDLHSKFVTEIVHCIVVYHDVAILDDEKDMILYKSKTDCNKGINLITNV